ncbi:hypothetical protein [Acanthopleuribacter pedis]|uniref:Uncharacterized protein n=1 Tax=Acanthopleuribacter pedis TaxID=442870 RepID=A0A8J7QM87_9BACT|nr:hypothetical protein [Acanthopleuribacter pedis]MBO1320948.1 hypothetical protein [Acanthopleuribacter pedis]
MFPVTTPMPRQETAEAWLKHMNNALGHSRPRRFPFFQRLNNYLEPPAWLKLRPQDPLHGIYQFQKELYRAGELVWGFVLQGHEDLFEPERDNHAALLLHGGVGASVGIHTLAECAKRLGRWLDQTGPGSDHGALRRVLLDPHGRVFSRPVPNLTNAGEPGPPVYCSSLLVHREHLPIGWLPFAWLPLLVLPHQPYIAAVLPYWYWPQPFQERWRERAMDGLKLDPV